MTTTAPPSRSSGYGCPACGHRIPDLSLPYCPACHVGFADDRVTGADVSPYARAYHLGEPGWRRMLEWVWFAGSQRLKHLALIRASAASRRFACLNVLLLAIGLALVQGARVGWCNVSDMVSFPSTGPIGPDGNGWIHVVSGGRLPAGQAKSGPVDLWWNLPQAVIGIGTGAVAGFLIIWLALTLLRWGVSRAHVPSFRGAQRMTAAIHYSTAWALCATLGAFVAGLRTVSRVGRAADWPWYPPDRAFVLAAAVFAAFGAIMWWFWLARLGAAAPAKTRARVTAFLVLGPPLITAGAVAVWWWGLDRLYNPLFQALNLTF